MRSQQLFSKIILAMLIVNCAFVFAEEDQSPATSFLQTKGLDFSARVKDQFASSACETQCKKVGGYPCGRFSLACCLSSSYCSSSWGVYTCTVPIRAFIC